MRILLGLGVAEEVNLPCVEPFRRSIVAGDSSELLQVPLRQVPLWANLELMSALWAVDGLRQDLWSIFSHQNRVLKLGR